MLIIFQRGGGHKHMGGRGASTGISVSGKTYGKSMLTSGNIKFVVKLDGNVTAPR